jgi:plasmid replication initiation protein
MDEEYNLNKNHLVVKGNALIEGLLGDLSTIELKLLISAISNIRASDKVLDVISFSAKDFCNLIKANKAGMYTYLKNACDKLLKRTVTIKTDENNWVKFPWIYRIQYKNGVIMINFHHDLEPYLLFCKENKMYTKYLLENIIDMDSKFSIRLYELLKQYKQIGYRLFEINEFKNLLGIPLTKYKKFDNLRRKVLHVSLNEINGLTDINISIEEIKEGRKITKLKYIIVPKNYKMTTNKYELLPKLKLISILCNRINEKTGYIFNFKDLNIYHRIILIDLIKQFDRNNFNDVLIQYPNAFFKWHLDDIKKRYDLSNIEDY